MQHLSLILDTQILSPHFPAWLNQPSSANRRMQQECDCIQR